MIAPEVAHGQASWRGEDTTVTPPILAQVGQKPATQASTVVFPSLASLRRSLPAHPQKRRVRAALSPTRRWRGAAEVVSQGAYIPHRGWQMVSGLAIQRTFAPHGFWQVAAGAMSQRWTMPHRYTLVAARRNLKCSWPPLPLLRTARRLRRRASSLHCSPARCGRSPLTGGRRGGRLAIIRSLHRASLAAWLIQAHANHEPRACILDAAPPPPDQTPHPCGADLCSHQYD